ncbi:MAG: hypothetical protein D3905_17090 [Candidatus Electrothrix sp. AS4_5]|nr:hypothetical protein [Candidatus Electrothrix gigas]
MLSKKIQATGPEMFIAGFRNKEVREFIQRVLELQGRPFIYGFKGMGGVGKTEIAKELCYIFHDTWEKQPKLENLTDLLSQKKGGFFLDGILWIQFHPEGQTPKTLTDNLILELIEQYSEARKKKKEPDELAEEKENIEKINGLDLEALANSLAGKDVLLDDPVFYS